MNFSMEISTHTYWNSKTEDWWRIVHTVNNCIVLNVINFNMSTVQKRKNKWRPLGAGIISDWFKLPVYSVGLFRLTEQNDANQVQPPTSCDKHLVDLSSCDFHHY